MSLKPNITPVLLSLVTAFALALAGYMSVQISQPLKTMISSYFPMLKNRKNTIKNDRTIFIPLPPLMVGTRRNSTNGHLRLEAQIQTLDSYKDHVIERLPIFLDAINSYLQTLSYGKLSNPEALITTRLQLLRRLQILAGEGVIKNILITKMIFLRE